MVESLNYYLNKDEPNRSCLLALCSIILNQDQNISETWKWGMPCFRYKNKIFCYLSIDKKTNDPYLLMVEGKFLNLPELETGKRTKMKIFRINPNQDLPLQTIQNILQEGLNLYKLGKVKINIKKQ